VYGVQILDALRRIAAKAQARGAEAYSQACSGADAAANHSPASPPLRALLRGKLPGGYSSNQKKPAFTWINLIGDLRRSPDALAWRVSSFAPSASGMQRLGRSGATPLPRLRSPTSPRHLRRDEAALFAALKQPWSNGPVDGHIHRLKLVERSMYGRAQFDLLRLRVLCAA